MSDIDQTGGAPVADAPAGNTHNQPAAAPTGETTPPPPVVDAEQWRSTVVLGDGTTAVIRPIRPTDAPVLAEFHARQSAESRYRRYFSPKPELSPSDLERFTNVDFIDRAAFVVEEHGEFIAWASYERWTNRTDAEVAFQVDDQHHGRGIATLLLEHLAAVAQHNDIQRFTAQTLGENRGMLAVFSKAGWPVHRRFESGVIDVDFPLDTTDEYIDSVERREQRADSRAIARLLLPSSIAVIGASDDVDSPGGALWANLTRGASCPVYAVNPAHATIGDLPAYNRVTDIDGDVGLAIIAVPASQLNKVIDDCIEKRVRGAVVVTVVERAEVSVSELVARARRNGLRIIGPASMGIASPRPDVRLQASLAYVSLPPGRVAISMQSGTLGSSLLGLANRLDLGLSWFVSLGAKRDVSANDLLQFWEDDEATAVIAIYTESLGNPRKFARIARRVSRTKPIVAVRTGAALVGTATAAMFRQTGVIEVPTVVAMLDTARVFATQPPLDGDRIAVISNSRSPETLARATLNAAGVTAIDPPVQLDWHSTDDDYRTAIDAALADPGVDGILIIHAPPVALAVGGPAAIIDDAGKNAEKPIIAVMLGTADGPVRPGSRVPSFAFPEQAAATFGRVGAWSAWRRQETIDGPTEVTRIDSQAAQELIDAHVDAGTMEPTVLRELLATYSIKMAPTELVDADEAVAAANRIGYPVAVKAIRRGLGRSAEAGIALDLADDADVESVVATMVEHLGDDAEQVYVQRMNPPGVDLRVHASDDPKIGPIVTAGLGGWQADIIADEETRLAPVSPSVARSMVGSTRAAALLDDDATDRATDLVSRVSQLIADHPEIVDLDLNPTLVFDDGVCVLDAAIALREPDRAEPAVRRLE